MEFTQRLGVGLGLAVGINPHYSHPVFTDNAQICTQQSMRHRKTCGIPVTYSGMLMQDQEHVGNENHADDMQMRQTDKSWWMMSQTSHTKQSHKSVAQLNHMG